jgi:CRISPR-associated protein Csb3
MGNTSGASVASVAAVDSIAPAGSVASASTSGSVGSVPVDLLNPGQVFACVGLMEAAELLCGPCHGAFVGDRGESFGTFELTTVGTEHPVDTVLDFLWRARADAVAPWQPASETRPRLEAKESGVRTIPCSDTIYPCPRPDTPSALPIVLVADGSSVKVPIEHWADESRRDKLKLWAGAGGYSGAALARDALDALAAVGDQTRAKARRDPFSLDAPMTSSFRFDWRRDYIPLDVGFSPNNHGASVRMVGYPFVELLAAIGLQYARPACVTPRDKLAYRYAVSSESLPTPFVRAVLGGADLGFPIRRFRMQLGWPGQKDQARCIVDAQEEHS